MVGCQGFAWALPLARPSQPRRPPAPRAMRDYGNDTGRREKERGKEVRAADAVVSQDLAPSPPPGFPTISPTRRLPSGLCDIDGVNMACEWGIRGQGNWRRTCNRERVRTQRGRLGLTSKRHPQPPAGAPSGGDFETAPGYFVGFAKAWEPTLGAAGNDEELGLATRPRLRPDLLCPPEAAPRALIEADRVAISWEFGAGR